MNKPIAIVLYGSLAPAILTKLIIDYRNEILLTGLSGEFIENGERYRGLSEQAKLDSLHVAELLKNEGIDWSLQRVIIKVKVERLWELKPSHLTYSEEDSK